LSDITILFEGGEKLPAHRILLYARSQFFRFGKLKKENGNCD